MTVSYVRLPSLREVLNSVQALRGVPAVGVMEEWAGSFRRRTLESGGDFPHNLRGTFKRLCLEENR